MILDKSPEYKEPSYAKAYELSFVFLRFWMRGFPIIAQYPTKGRSNISIFSFSHVRYGHPSRRSRGIRWRTWDSPMRIPLHFFDEGRHVRVPGKVLVEHYAKVPHRGALT